MIISNSCGLENGLAETFSQLYIDKGAFMLLQPVVMHENPIICKYTCQYTLITIKIVALISYYSTL